MKPQTRMVRLSDLNPKLLVHTGNSSARFVDTIKEANGISFLCPLCFLANERSSVGVHSIKCWSPGVPDDVVPGPGRWSIAGTSIDDLSLFAKSSSVHLLEGCRWHGYVQKGWCHTDLSDARIRQVQKMWLEGRH